MTLGSLVVIKTCVPPVFLGIRSCRSFPSHQSFSISRLSMINKYGISRNNSRLILLKASNSCSSKFRSLPLFFSASALTSSPKLSDRFNRFCLKCRASPPTHKTILYLQEYRLFSEFLPTVLEFGSLQASLVGSEHFPSSKLIYFPALVETSSLSSSSSPSDCPLVSPLLLVVVESRYSPFPKKAISISMISFSLPRKHLFLGKGRPSNPSTACFSATLFLPSFAWRIAVVLATQPLQLLSLASSLNS